MSKMRVQSFEDLEEARADYIKRAEDRAEEIRSVFITLRPGQAMSYDAKYKEAVRWPNGNAASYHWINAEAEMLGVDPQVVVDSVLAARASWEQIGAIIEVKRLQVKQQIRDATSYKELGAALREFKIENMGLPAPT